MTIRETAPVGAPCWIELFSTDIDAARTFYGELFGWESVSAGEEYGGYVNFSKDGRKVAGAMGNDGTAGMPDAWTTYLASADIDADCAAVAANGGQVHLPPMQVMALGSMALVADPGGAAVGVWQPGEHQGFEIWDEPDTASWFELHTDAYDASVAFYRTVFGWDTHTVMDVPEFRYTTLGEGDHQLAGMMDNRRDFAPGERSRWEIYFGSTDVDATLAKIVELGGAVTIPAEDTPYGRLAGATDTTGTAFKLRGAY